MKSSHIVLASVLLGCAIATGTLNYNQNSATVLGCSASGSPPLSPVNLTSTTCAPFGTFNLNFTNINNVAPTASPVINNLIVDLQGSVEFNGTTYQTYAVAFHSPSENMIDGVQADLEMQVYLNNTAGIAAVASFLFLAPSSVLNSQDNSTMGRQFVLNQTQSQIVTSLGSTWNINLNNLANIVNNKYQTDAFLNMYTFTSTLNFNDGSATCNPVQWFVYGGGLYVPQAVLTQFAGQIQAQASALNINLNTTLSQSGYAGNNLQPNQPANLQVTRLCFSGYFLVTMNSNYGLWFAWGLTVLFFIVTLVMEEKPINNIDYVEDPWTHHPLYSVAKVGNNVFTRKSRCASILVQIINQFVWNAVFFSMNYSPSSPTPNTVNVIIFPLIATAIGWGVLYFIGIFLRMYYIKKSESESAEGEHREDHNDSAQFYIYIYYLLVVVLVCVGFSFTIAALDQVQSYNNPATANLWVAAVFVGLGLDWIIFDPLVCMFVASSEGLRGLLRWKGHLYDKTCHETYLNALKRE